jgi:hypothetical protein
MIDDHVIVRQHTRIAILLKETESKLVEVGVELRLLYGQETLLRIGGGEGGGGSEIRGGGVGRAAQN